MQESESTIYRKFCGGSKTVMIFLLLVFSTKRKKIGLMNVGITGHLMQSGYK